MSVNISVSGKTLKECHEQILALANEINGYTHEEPVVQQAPVQQAPAKFDIKPEVASVPQRSNEAANLQAVQATGSNQDVDSRGLPWDSRIHSSNKEKGKDGVWRRRRGVSEEVEAQVEAELRGQVPAPAKQVPPFGSMNQQQYQQAVTPAPVAPAPMPTTEHRVALPAGPNVLAEAQIPAQPMPNFAPPAPVQVLPPNTHNAESFRSNLVNILNDLVVAGKINHQWINDQKPQFGGKDVTQWHENQAACAGLFEMFVQYGLVNKL